MEKKKWTPPEIVSFSCHAMDANPVFFPNSERLLFYSRRSRSEVQEDGMQAHWIIERHRGGWSELRSFNIPSGCEFIHAAVSVSRTGTLNLNANSPENLGGADLYFCRPDQEGCRSPENLGIHINSEGDRRYLFLRVIVMDP